MTYCLVLRHSTVITILCLGATVTAAQQSTAPYHASETQTLQELLSEVRQLRLALERASSMSFRLQITLQRLQWQQNQVNRVASELDSVRGSLGRAESEQAQLSAHLSDIETRLSQEQNPDRQKGLQEEQKGAKRILEQQTRNAQDLRAREGELAASLQREQSKLNEVQGRLDALEKAAEPSAAQ